MQKEWAKWQVDLGRAGKVKSGSSHQPFDPVFVFPQGRIQEQNADDFRRDGGKNCSNLLNSFEISTPSENAHGSDP